MIGVASHAFWSWQFALALFLNSIIQCVLIAAYAARVAGVVSGRVATSISFFNLFAIASRTASLLYTPLLGSLSDAAALTARLPTPNTTFQLQLRSIVAAGTLGACAGALFLPTFVRLFLAGIKGFERYHSVPRVLFIAMREARPSKLLVRPSLSRAALARYLSLNSMPKQLLLINVLVTGIYAIGVIAAAYASVLDPQIARTALLSSGFVNGAAMIAYSVVVDPGSSLIVDQAVRGERTVDDVRRLVAYLSLTTIVGMLLSQLLLVPAAYIVVDAAHVVTGR